MQNITCNNYTVSFFGRNASRGSFVMDGQIIMQPGAIAWVGDTKVTNTSSRTMIRELKVVDSTVVFEERDTDKVQIKNFFGNPKKKSIKLI